MLTKTAIIYFHNNDSLITPSWIEMKQLSYLDSHVQNMKSMLNIESLHGDMDTIGHKLDKKVKSALSIFTLSK